MFSLMFGPAEPHHGSGCRVRANARRMPIGLLPGTTGNLARPENALRDDSASLQSRGANRSAMHEGHAIGTAVVFGGVWPDFLRTGHGSCVGRVTSSP